MFPDPDRLLESSPAEVLAAASRAHLGLDHRFLHSILDRPGESIPAVLEFAQHDLRNDQVDLTPELIALFRYWKNPESLPFLLKQLKAEKEEVSDEVVETLVAIGQPALEPLLKLYEELDESESGEVAFVLAHLPVHDERILQLLLDRLEYDLSDTALLLGLYGDPAAKPALEQAASKLGRTDRELKKEIAEALTTIDEASRSSPTYDDTFDIWSLYPERAELPVDLLDEDERLKLLRHPSEDIRAAAAASFFNSELGPELRKEMIALAQQDSSAKVRARAWEALMDSTEDSDVVAAMLSALRKTDLPATERGGLLVGLASETDRNEVRAAILELYKDPEGRAKALEAMWRSVHPFFREFFARHLDDSDIEVRRGALWGVGYYGLRTELQRVRKLFEDEDLRSDALFAYALAIPAEVSRGRMKGLLARIEKDAHGLSEMEEELVMAALDERLMLAGKEPVFTERQD